MQTVVADVSVGSNENPRGYRGLQCRRPRRLSGIEVQRFKHACKKGYRTYDNQTEERQLSHRTTYRISECRVARTGIQSERGKEGLVKKFTSCALHAISSSTLSQPHHLLFLQLRSCFSIACNMPLWLQVCGTTLVPLVRTRLGSVQLWCGSGLVTLILLFLFYSQTI